MSFCRPFRLLKIKQHNFKDFDLACSAISAIYLNRNLNLYYYFERIELEVSIKVKAISKNNTVKLYGGTFFDKKHFPASLWQ